MEKTLKLNENEINESNNRHGDNCSIRMVM